MTNNHPRRRGIRLTERFLLPFLGPAQVADARRRRAVTDAQRERETALRDGLRRVVGPDGKSYMVEGGDGG